MRIFTNLYQLAVTGWESVVVGCSPKMRSTLNTDLTTAQWSTEGCVLTKQVACLYIEACGLEYITS